MPTPAAFTSTMALSTPDEPSRALIQGVRELLRDTGAAPESLGLVVHSATLATNAIIERKGAKTALLTTRGFRDVLEMGREQIYDMHDLHGRIPGAAGAALPAPRGQ